MNHNTALKVNTLFEIPRYGLTILADQYANLFFKTEHAKAMPLADLPRELQIPFFLIFLHNDRLAECFKNYEILGAIDIYIKSTFFLGKKLGLDD